MTKFLYHHQQETFKKVLVQLNNKYVPIDSTGANLKTVKFIKHLSLRHHAVLNAHTDILKQVLITYSEPVDSLNEEK